MQEFGFNPIGVVESPYKEKFGTPRQPGLVQGAEGAVVLRPDLNADALEGLSEFSHAWLVFVFHKSEQSSVKTKVHPPRLVGKAIGVFATRSPHRPNNIGLSLVKIVRVEGRRLVVQGLDLIEGTPVLDIKPYLPAVEAIADAKSGWTGTADAAAEENATVVEWTKEALNDLDKTAAVATLKSAIEDIIKLDPRPVAYRGNSGNPNPYTATYGFRHGQWNVVFKRLDDNQVSVLRVEPWPNSGQDG